MKKKIAVSGAVGPAFLTTVGVMGLALIGSALVCISSSTVDDDAPLEAEGLPATLPVNTQMVIRIDPRQPDEMDALADVLRVDQPASSDWTDADADQRISAMISAVMMPEHDGLLHTVFGLLVAEPPDEVFDGLDVVGPVVLAVVWRDDEFSRDFSSGVPIGGERTEPEGMAVRLYVPSDDPETLVDELMEWGKEMRASQVIDISTRDNFVAIDVSVYEPWMGLRELSARPDWDALLGDEDDAYWTRDTPALSGFMETDASVALHVRTAALASQRVYHWLGHYDFYNSPTPEDRAAGRSSLITSTTLSAKLHDPMAREFDDHTLIGRIDDADSFEVEIYSTHTEQGEEVHGRATHDVEIPTIEIGEPVAQLEWNFDLEDSLSAADPPEWMTDTSVNEVETLVNQVDENDMMFAFVAHPMATNRGILEATEEESSLEWSRGLLAARLVIADSGGPLTVDDVPPFAATAALAPESPVAGHVDALIAEGEASGVFEELGLFVDVVDMEDHRLLRVATGELRDAFGDNAAVEPLAVDIDTEAAQPTLEWLADLRLPRTLLQWLEHPLFETGQPFSARRHLSPEASAMRLAMGDNGDKTLEIPTGARGFVDSEGPSDCYRDVVAVSRSGLGGRFGRPWPHASDRRAFRVAEGPSEFAHRMHDEMRKARSQCDDDARADELDYLLARWTTYRGLVDAAHLRHNEARRWMDEACELGDQWACDGPEVLRDWDVRVPGGDDGMIDVDTSTFGVADLSPTVVTPEGVGRIYLSPFERHTSTGYVTFDEVFEEFDDALLRSLSEPMGSRYTWLTLSESDEERAFIAALTADRRVSSEDMAGLMDLIADHTEAIVESDRTSGGLRPDEIPDLDAVAFVVDADSGDPDIWPTVLFTLDDTSDVSVSVDINSRGVDLRFDGDVVSPVDGCPSQGPTLCVDDADAVESMATELLDGADHDVYDRLVDHYPLASLPELVDETIPGAIDGIVFAADDDLPFGLVASAAAHIWSSDAIDDDHVLNFHFDDSDVMRARR